MRIKKGDKFGQTFPSWVKGGEGKFMETYTVAGRHKKYGSTFIECVSERNGEKANIAKELLEDETFYKKII